MNIALQTHMWRKYCGRLTDIVALKTNDSYCYFLSRQGKFPESRLYILGKCPSDIEKAVQKGYLCSLAEKGRGTDP